jgi:hypothetical protein
LLGASSLVLELARRSFGSKRTNPIEKKEGGEKKTTLSLDVCDEFLFLVGPCSAELISLISFFLSFFLSMGVVVVVFSLSLSLSLSLAVQLTVL